MINKNEYTISLQYMYKKVQFKLPIMLKFEEKN